MQYDPARANAGYDALYANSLRYAIGAAERGSAMPFEFPGLNASPQALFEYNKDAQWWLYERSKQSQVGNEGAAFAFTAAVGGAYSFLKAIPEAIGGFYDIATQPMRDMQDMYLYLGTDGRHGVSPDAVEQRRLQTFIGLQQAMRHPIPNVVKPWYDTTIAAYDRGDGFTYGMRVTDASIAVVTTFAGGGAGAGGKAGMVSREAGALRSVAANTLPELKPSIRSTFLNGEATMTVLDEPLIVQRFHGGGSSAKGSFSTTDIFKSRVDVREQLALPYTWSDGAAGNAVTKVTTIELPAGTRIWSGRAAPQIDGISGRVYQGGGNQIWTDAWIKDDWMMDTRWFRSDRGKN